MENAGGLDPIALLKQLIAIDAIAHAGHVLAALDQLRRRLESATRYPSSLVWDERFASAYGDWRAVIPKVVDQFLTCGLFEHGFARIAPAMPGGVSGMILAGRAPTIV